MGKEKKCAFEKDKSKFIFDGIFWDVKKAEDGPFVFYVKMIYIYYDKGEEGKNSVILKK